MAQTARFRRESMACAQEQQHRPVMQGRRYLRKTHAHGVVVGQHVGAGADNKRLLPGAFGDVGGGILDRGSGADQAEGGVPVRVALAGPFCPVVQD